MSSNSSNIWTNVTRGNHSMITRQGPPMPLDITRHISWGFFVVFVLALFGNTIIVIVMNKPRNRELASSTFFTALAVSDLLHATQSSMEKWVMFVLQEHLYGSAENTFMGGIKIPINFSNLQTSTFLLVGITIERLMCITLPHKVKRMCTPFNARLWVLFTVVISFGLHMSAYLFLYDVTIFPVFRIEAQVPYGDQIFHVLDMIFGFVFPFVFISIGSGIIIIHIKRRVSSDSASSRASAATINLIMANIAFLITISPFRTLNILTYFKLMETTPTKQAFKRASMIILDSNCAVNFFVYCLGSPRFRQDIKELFGLAKKTPPTTTKSTSEMTVHSVSKDKE